ncbi:uncharacterized protein Triagg1_8272 [Trichoderma aggressivum f. europaeum]|uniref:BTB domain-containing protein n=1 Tax=Trichoderma aggressivum f. europaeum TaxID=173218 RepID=A0AAE1I8B4_9HYPO|nr:hypothetical protein Triagg1_8272 [Trichoderma aggressivum f. europaeum]
MASLPYKSITASPPFTFLVGPEQKEHTIHSALVARQSKALNALVNGRMKEATERRAIWGEIDEETFIRFSQYVYTGNYDESEPKKRQADTLTPSQAEQNRAVFSEWNGLRLGVGGRVMRQQGGVKPPPISTKKDLLWNRFQKLHPLPSARAVSLSTNGPDDDYTDVFLCHARTYVFADYYGIEALQTMALHKLRQALTRFKLHANGCGDVTRLVEYCFNETTDKGEQTDPLRSLVCLYAACKVEELWKVAEFQDLMRTLPEFPTGLITAMLDRLD